MIRLRDGAYAVASDEVAASYAKARNRMLLSIGVMAAMMAIAAGVIVLVRRRVTSPITRMTAAMRGIAEGALDTEVPGIGRRDEIGGMAGALETFRTALIERVRLQDAAARCMRNTPSG